MIILFEPSVDAVFVDRVESVANRYPGITVKRQTVTGATDTVTELHLHGKTGDIPTEPFETLPGVHSVTRVSRRYRLIARHRQEQDSFGFTYNGVSFDDDNFHLFAGLCAVDNQAHVEQTMAALANLGLTTTRMGAYKPRTSPYDFQGHGSACLSYVFDLAGKYGIRIIAMEVTRPRHIEEIRTALQQTGNATGVMLQIGTRNAQNFELLREVGQQRELPVLFKRGMGITLEESLNAAEYIASEGNPRIVFCLRGVKSHLGEPHRNLVDFAHVPVLRRITRLPVCIDPSHSVGVPHRTPDGMPDIFHALSQGIISGANMALVDVHPKPDEALCDGPQALTLDELPWLHDHVLAVRSAYEHLKTLVPQAKAKQGASTTNQNR
jgi:3-deoxy-7-phosphoheptulonate synthase